MGFFAALRMKKCDAGGFEIACRLVLTIKISMHLALSLEVIENFCKRKGGQSINLSSRPGLLQT